MIWETRGTKLYSTHNGKDHLITPVDGGWRLYRRWLGDTRWERVGDYRRPETAKEAAT